MFKLALIAVIAFCFLCGLPNAQVLQRTGYYAATCTAPLLAHEYNPINTCVSNSTGDNHSFIISTTSTTYNQTFYIDSACTQVNTSVTFPLNACVNISALATTAEVVDQIFTPYQVEYYGMNSFYGSSCTGNRTQPITRTIYNYLCSDYTAAAGQSFPVSGLVTCNSTTIFVNFYFGSSCYDAVISTRFVASIGCQRDGTVNECIYSSATLTTTTVGPTISSTSSTTTAGATTNRPATATTSTTASSSSTVIAPCALLFALAMMLYMI